MNLVEVEVELGREAHFEIAEGVGAGAAGRKEEDILGCTVEKES